MSAASDMRKLPIEEREAAIAASDNVIGYSRFIDKAQQVAIRDAKYKRHYQPTGPRAG